MPQRVLGVDWGITTEYLVDLARDIVRIAPLVDNQKSCAFGQSSKRF